MRTGLICVLGFGLMLAACQPPAKQDVTDAVVSLPAVAGRPGVAYFTLKGGPQENRLMGVRSPQVIRIELHESLMRDGMMTMAPLEAGVSVPVGGVVKFEPGGKHAMLFDINPKVGPGTKMKLIFSYANGQTIEADADVKAAGDAGAHAH